MDLRSHLLAGQAIPAHPLALDANGRFSERHQRAITRYYLAAGAGGLAVGVHSTQFEIRLPQHGLFRPVLELAARTFAEEQRRTPRPVAMIAGLTTLAGVSADGFYERLSQATDRLVAGLKSAADDAGVPLATNHVCGMFGFFFTSAPKVERYSQATACDVERFKKFFHAMLDEGVYLAPSAFEAGFVSAAHTPEIIDASIAAARRAFARLK